MPDEKSKHKLSARNQLDLCALLATGYNPQRCADIFEEEYGISITPENIGQNYARNKKWQKIIKRMSREAERKVLQHPLAKKMNRLNLLRDAINEAFTWRLDKIHYDKDGNELSRVEKRNIGMISALIREARAEIEKESGPIQIGDNAKIVFQDIKIEGRPFGDLLKDVNNRLAHHATS